MYRKKIFLLSNISKQHILGNERNNVGMWNFIINLIA